LNGTNPFAVGGRENISTSTPGSFIAKAAKVPQ
jgi:hypothetical protein